MTRRLFKCVVHNHPWAECYAYYEEEDGLVQKLRMRETERGLAFDGYEGLMFPFEQLRDACVLVDYGSVHSDEVGILQSKIKSRNCAQEFFLPDELN